MIVSERRYDEIADGMIELDRVTVVSERAARLVAAAYPPEPQKINMELLADIVRQLDEAGVIEVMDLDGERVIE